ncbi:MAG: GGDEF domain-containing protein [Campylobacterota bacterium]|nr:GGDEF domain-containing protein [Campylobacterota bacterium]
MLLPQIKEREYRFKLALRMGVPIVTLVLVLISSTLITTYESLQLVVISSILFLIFSVYFILHLIYKGFDVKITEPVSKVFTRDYLYKYIKKDMRFNVDYTLILISIENINFINTHYGIKNGDKIIYEIAKNIIDYIEGEKVYNFPIGHINGADFMIGLRGKKEQYISAFELFCLKYSELKINNIEVNILGAITDTTYSNDLDYMVENLFEMQEENRTKHIVLDRDDISPSDLEIYVINAIRSKSISMMTQEVFENKKPEIVELFVKLKNVNGKLLHPLTYMKVVNKLGLRTEYDMMILQKSILHYKFEDSTMLAMNIAPSTLRDKKFLLKVKELIDDNLYVKNKIIFILDEIGHYSNVHDYNLILKSLKNLGIKIALDRLGMVHSTFLYLRDMDIDIVRFDSIYTKDINNKKYNSIIEGFNLMAHSLGVKTWMKMVENEEAYEFAKKIEIDYIQGKQIASLIKIYED